MANNANRQKLFKFFEKTLKERDRFQSVVLKVSEFGLVQMTRKRSGKTLIQQMTDPCSCCSGDGFVKSVPTEAYIFLRELKKGLVEKKLNHEISAHVHEDLFDYLIATEYNALLHLEKTYNCKITLTKNGINRLSEYSITGER
jgi:ribonuclease G